MEQTERRKYLIESLLAERGERTAIPLSEEVQKRLLRALFNVRPPHPVGEAFLRVQDEYLQEEIRRKGITGARDLSPVAPELYLWRGDITLLQCDGIVNAANSRLLGCFCPNHGCIDNAIHTFAGVQLRLACFELMRKQGRGEKTGTAKITPAYNLPCKAVLHTVGPIVGAKLTDLHRKQLSDCYRACLDLAEENGLESVAFPCISTGEFHFPNEEAALVAVATVREWKEKTGSKLKIIFNVFTEKDEKIYARIFGTNQ